MISDYTHSAPPARSTHAGLQQAGCRPEAWEEESVSGNCSFYFLFWWWLYKLLLGKKIVQLCIYKIFPFLCFIFLEVKRQKAACKISCDIKLDGISRQVKKLITTVLQSVPRTT